MNRAILVRGAQPAVARRPGMSRQTYYNQLLEKIVHTCAFQRRRARPEAVLRAGDFRLGSPP